MGNSGCLAQGKPAAAESRYPPHGACWEFQCFHNTPNSDMDCRIFDVRTVVNACDSARGCTDTVSVCTESRLWEKNPLLHRGTEPASAVSRSDALPTELHPHSVPRSNQLLQGTSGADRRLQRMCDLIGLLHWFPVVTDRTVELSLKVFRDL